MLDPDGWGATNATIYEWRQYLKRQLLIQRRYRSDLSGKLLHGGCDMHEGFVIRSDVPKNIWWQYKIFHPYNSFLLLPEEHRVQAPSREQCIEIAYARYGKENVLKWYYSLPFKVFPKHWE